MADMLALSSGSASPLSTPLRVRDRAPGRLVTSLLVDPREPLLAGHYPGLPIFPGVCLVECAHRSALAALADRETRAARIDGGAPVLAGIESARFLRPVFPGFEVTTEVTVAAVADGWRCSARLRAAPVGPRADEAAEVAVVRLRYRPAGDPPGGPA